MTDGAMQSVPEASFILLVEDEDLLRSIFVRALKQAGHAKVEDFQTAEEAQGRVANGVPSVMIVDYHLPGISGIELVRWFRASQNKTIASVPIIVLSGSVLDNDEKGALQAGADAYLLKPCHLRDLLDAVKRLTRDRKTR